MWLSRQEQRSSTPRRQSWASVSRTQETHLVRLGHGFGCRVRGSHCGSRPWGQTLGPTSHAWDRVRKASARDRAQGLALETSGRETPAQAQGMSDPESRAAARGLTETGPVRVAAEEPWTAPKVST